MDCDILIVGGTTGGTAAALASAELGLKVCLVEETEWLGGQLTTQGVCTPDEQQYIETFGGTRRYSAFRQAIRHHYRTNFTLSEAASTVLNLNPGSCWVSRISFEPRVGAQILMQMAQPFVDSGALSIAFGARVTSVFFSEANPDTITTVDVLTMAGETIRYCPTYLLDATDLGDLLPLAGVEGEDWITGAESFAQTGEPDAPQEPKRHWVQPFTFPFAIEWSPETVETNTIPRPANYEALKALQKYHVKHGAITGLFSGAMPWWRYRRMLASENFNDARIPADVAMINTAGNDYYGGNIIGTNEAGEAQSQVDIDTALESARQASLGYLYWLQTECEREPADLEALPNNKYQTPNTCAPAPRGYPEFRLRTDVFNTSDGCSERPYIRESRRICALSAVKEQDIVVKDFSGTVCRGDNARARFMPDTVGIGHYALDIHPNGHGEPNHYVATRPFQIPLGTLIPKRLSNLLPACKNLGLTHLTNGAYRLHPIEWNIGESAGLLAAWCILNRVAPKQVYATPELLAQFQLLLIDQGIALHWYVDVPDAHPAFAAVQWLASTGTAIGSETDLLFRPDDLVDPSTWVEWSEACGVSPATNLPKPESRADGAVFLFYHRAPEVRRRISVGHVACPVP